MERPEAVQRKEEKRGILVVDDDESTRRSLALIFKRKGYRVETAGTGQEALTKARGRPPRLALLDIRLPDMDGVALLARLKGVNPDMAVIMVTGHASVETAVKALNEGATAYVLKPLDLDQVMVTVSEALERQRLIEENKRLYEEAQQELARRKIAQEALEESERKYRTLFDEARDGIVLVDRKTGRIVDCNPEFERLTGRPLQDLRRSKIWEIRPPDRVETGRQKFLEIAQSGVGDPAELEFQKPDGEIVHIEFVSREVSIGDRRYLQSMCRDITERRRAEEALQVSETLYRLLADNVADVLFTTDIDLRFTYVSPSVTRQMGYSVEELLREPPEAILTPESAKLVRRATAEEFASGESGDVDRARSRKVELEVCRKDGTIIWTEVEATVLRDAGGRPSGILGVARDIAERKIAEEEVASHTRRVEALYSVAQTLSGTLDLDQLLEGALAKVDEVVGSDTGTIHVLDMSEKALLLKAHTGIAEEALAEVAAVRLSVQDFQRLLRWTEPRTQSVASDLLAGVVPRNRMRSFVTVPLLVKGQLQGVLSVSSGDKVEFTSDEVDLLRAISHEIGVGIENSRLLEKTRELSITDELTGLYNRRHFYGELENETNRTRRYGRAFSMAMLDLDGFKEYNDRFGHTTGDSVLISFARTLRSALRKTDSAFRYGGDEFAVILPSSDAQRAKTTIRRVRAKWTQAAGSRFTIQDDRLGFSAGITQFPGDAETADGLVFLADTALFRSKRLGGNTSTLVSELGALPAELLDTTTLDQVYALAATVDARDPSTYGHSKRVATISELIGKAVGLKGDELVKLHAAALLHDIGKIGVPDSILTKPQKPAKHEWKIIRQHSAEGARIIGYVRELSELANLVRHHHEWYDGTGYPDGLKGKDIPLGARIISIADAYDTMTTPRPYRAIIKHGEACQELGRCSGTQFDPELVEVFVRVTSDIANRELVP